MTAQSRTDWTLRSNWAGEIPGIRNAHGTSAHPGRVIILPAILSRAHDGGGGS
jgi:hypothetical protein